jgi:hypothetical protein
MAAAAGVPQLAAVQSAPAPSVTVCRMVAAGAVTTARGNMTAKKHVFQKAD